MDDALKRQAREDARRALEEDIGSGDLSAALVPAAPACATLLCRERDIVLCGRAWFESCFLLLGDAEFDWLKTDGDVIECAGADICRIRADSRTLLSGERSAINFLQTLSATATRARFWRQKAGGQVTVVDTRKTLPLLRAAQKYAARTGGVTNHRMGLYDEILIKENHIARSGGIAQAFARARETLDEGKIQVEVQNLAELQEALDAQVKRIMLDNFSVEDVAQAVALAKDFAVELEASGDINEANFSAYAATGVARISLGNISKDVAAVNFSLRMDAAH